VDKGSLGIAGLVAGIVGVLVGGFAYMQAGKALETASEALAAAEAAEKSAPGPAELRKAVREETTAAKADFKTMVADVRAEIRKLEQQAQSADILVEAKSHANDNAARNAEALMKQVKDLREEMAAGDQETKAYYDELKADIEKKVEESNEKLKRMTTRWMESGAM